MARGPAQQGVVALPPNRRPHPTSVLLSFFVPAIGFLLASAVATAIGTAIGAEQTRWLGLHLFLVGGASGLIMGAAPFFAGAFLAIGPAPRALARTQLVAWNAGAVVVPTGVLTGIGALTGIGGTLLAVGLAAFARSLDVQRRRSLQRRPWATRWYLTAAGFAALGVVLGILLAHGAAPARGDSVAAHRTLNLAGWIGGAIIGTLQTFYPALTRTRAAHPRFEAPTYACWLTGTATAALGYLLDLRPVTITGYILLLVAAVALGINMTTSLRRAPVIGLPAYLVGAGHVSLVAGLTLAVGSVAAPGAALANEARDVLPEVLVAGWIGLTVLGSLIHLLGIIGRRPSPAPPGGRRRDRVLAGVAVGAVITLTVSELMGGTPLDLPARLTVGVVYAVLATQVVQLAYRATRRARPRI